MKQKSINRIVGAATVGSVIEWYDVMIYSALATVIAKQFFPKGDEFVALLGTFGIFAIGYVARPLGGILLGIYGDRVGRIPPLSIAVVAMSLATGGIAFLPTYSEIGIFAPIILTILRVIQGLSIGGEFAGAITLVSEVVPKKRRGIYLSLMPLSASTGQLFGVTIGFLMTTVLSESLLGGNIWRVAFLLGVPVGAFGFYLRKRIRETPAFVKLKQAGKTERSPLKDLFKEHGATTFAAIGGLWVISAAKYFALTFIPSFLVTTFHAPLRLGLAFTGTYLITTMIFIPLIGAAVDRWGVGSIARMATILIGLLSIPIFLLIQAQSWVAILFAAGLFGLIDAPANGSYPSVLVNLFPNSVRYTGIGISLNSSAGLFGGTAPLVATALADLTGSGTLGPGLYLFSTAIISFICISYLIRSRQFKRSATINPDVVTEKVG